MLRLFTSGNFQQAYLKSDLSTIYLAGIATGIQKSQTPHN